jgi:hypothetical protein
MRSILHGDIVAAARVLLRVAPKLRRPVCRELLQEAETAFWHMETAKKIHRRWGDGSLMAAAQARGMDPEPSLSDVDYCSCLELVLHEVINWRSDRQIPI